MCEACAKAGLVPWHTTCRGPGERGAPWMPLLGPARLKEAKPLSIGWAGSGRGKGKRASPSFYGTF